MKITTKKSLPPTPSLRKFFFGLGAIWALLGKQNLGSIGAIWANAGVNVHPHLGAVPPLLHLLMLQAKVSACVPNFVADQRA